MANARRYIPEPSDPNYREYALFWNATNKAILDTADTINRMLGASVWIDLTKREQMIESAWLYLIDQREGTCIHSPEYGGTCMTCGHIVFTRDNNDDQIFPDDDEDFPCTTTQTTPPAPDA